MRGNADGGGERLFADRRVLGDVPEERGAGDRVETTELDTDETLGALALDARGRDHEIDRVVLSGELEVEVHAVAARERGVGHEAGADGRKVDHVGDVGAAVGEGQHRLDVGVDAQVVAGVGASHEDAERVEEERERREGWRHRSLRGRGSSRSARRCPGSTSVSARTIPAASIATNATTDKGNAARARKRPGCAELTRRRFGHERGERIGVEAVPAQADAVPELEDGRHGDPGRQRGERPEHAADGDRDAE